MPLRSLPAFGSRSRGRRGSGNCWFRYLRRLRSRWVVRAEPGALTGGWRSDGRPPRGGDLNQSPLRVSVVIPTHNEASAIGRVLADLPDDLVTEVLVVDSNSSDGTPEIARKMGARVIHEPRRGYGRACLTGLASASTPDVVVFLDGDYSDRPAELPLLLARSPTAVRISHLVHASGGSASRGRYPGMPRLATVSLRA